MIKGIDLSENNGYIPWDLLQAEGVKFCIARASYGKHGRDLMFAENVRQAHAHGMLCGAYHYDYSLHVDDAIANARNCRRAIDASGVMLELPVFYDLEDADGWKEQRGFVPDIDICTSMCLAFGEELGLHWGVYASYYWLKNYIDWKSLGCPIWNAEWGGNDDLKGYIWQYTDDYNGYRIDGNKMYDDSLFE